MYGSSNIVQTAHSYHFFITLGHATFLNSRVSALVRFQALAIGPSFFWLATTVRQSTFVLSPPFILLAL